MKNSILSKARAMRYHRQISLIGFDLDKQERLMNSRALLIGVGGLGCAAAQYLVSAGLGKLTIVDDDIVALTNLHRQVLHFEQNIGELKVDSAYRTLKAINKESEIDTIAYRPNNTQLQALLHDHDILIDCTDHLASRLSLNEISYTSNTPLVSGAAIRMEGQIFCAIPEQKTACYNCLSQLFNDPMLSCVEAGIMSPIVGIIGALQACEAIKIITDYGTPSINALQVFDGMTSRWETFKVNAKHDCPVCSSKR